MRKKYQRYSTIRKTAFNLWAKFLWLERRHLPYFRYRSNEALDIHGCCLDITSLDFCFLRPCHQSQITFLSNRQPSAGDSRNLLISKKRKLNDFKVFSQINDLILSISGLRNPSEFRHFTIRKLFCRLNIRIHCIFSFCFYNLFSVDCFKIIPELSRNAKNHL